MTQPNAQGETPLDIARLNGRLYVIHFLLESGKCSAPDMTELHIACMGRDEEKARNLASDIISLSTPDQYGITAVHYATCQPKNLSILVSIAEQKHRLSLLVGMDCRGNTPLHYAASCGCIKSVQILVSYYNSVNVQNSDGDTPLHLSIKSTYSNSDLVREILLHESCNLGTVNAQNETALRTASQCGKLDSAELLLLTGKCSPEDIKEAIEVNLLLHQAVASNRLELVKTLLNVPGCNINEFNSDEETPLHVACRSDFEVFKLLTADRRCDVNAKNKNGVTALHITIASGQFEKYNLLITNEDCNPNIVCSDGNAPLHMMIEKDCGRSLSILLEHSKCNPNMRNNEGNSALHLAVRRHSLACVTCLLQHDRVDPNIQNEIGNTPLHEAAITETPIEIMKSLICHKTINPNMKNNEGNSALHLAVRKHSSANATCLLQHDKINPNIQNETGKSILNHESIDLSIQNVQGNTPLHEAITEAAPVDLVEVLTLHSSCNPGKPNHEGMTPLQLSVDSGKMHYVEVLVTSGKCSQKDIVKAMEGALLLHQAVSTDRPRLVSRLTSFQECNMNETNSAGETALHVACSTRSSKAMLKILVEDDRCDLNVQDHHGNTALHLAVYSRTNVGEKVQCILQSERCNPNITNSEGYTPLHVAVKNGDFENTLHMAASETSLSYVGFFLNYKSIDLNIQNKEGNTPLHEAVIRKVPINVVEGLVLHKSCNPSTENSTGMTPLQISGDIEKLNYANVLITSGKCSLEDILKVTEGTPLLHKAVSPYRPKLIATLLNVKEFHVNRTNSAGETALHVACNMKDIKAILVVETLVEDSRCDLNAQNQSGNTALHLALCSEQQVAKKVQCILQSERCNPNITNSEGYTPLHVAVKERDFESAMIILNHSQCNPNIPDHTGNTPLHIAISEMSLSNVESFLNHKNIDLNIQNREGNTVLHKAVLRQTPVNIVEALTLNKTCNPNYEGMSPPQISGVVSKLVEDSRCDLNTQDQHGNTALHLAVYSGTDVAEKVQCIVQSERCNPNITNCKGFTPLHVAVENKQFQSAAMLLKHSDCNPNIQDLSGNTPLHLSIDNKPLLNVVEVFLLHKYIDLSIQNNSGDTVLHIAVLRKISLEVVAALILHKSCNLCITNSKGMTPLQTAVSSREIDVAAALITSKKCSHEDIAKATEDAGLLICAVLQEKAQLLTALIETGINVNATNSKGETALHIACNKGNSEATELLLRNGADILAVDHKGNAPIHVACENTTLECLNVLLSHHACNPNQQNAVGDTPLHILCNYEVSGDMSMLRTLLSIPGIDPKCANHAGQTPAELALYNYFVIEEISKYLKRKNAQLEAYLKIFVVGNSGGGKSTLIKAVTSEKRKSWKPVLKTKHVKSSEVPSHTAGIVPHRFNSQHFGHAVLYDFAGQHEYYSSHAAVMENLVLPSPPLFLLLIDISKPMEEIKKELVYWWMFINNHSKRTTAAPPHVILVGSHEDIVKERGGSVQETMEQITDIVKDIPVSFQFDHSKAFSLDCRKLVSQGLTALLTQLKLTCQTLRQNADVDLHCHILKAFLTTNFQSSIACEVSEIAEWTKLEDVLLPQESFRLISTAFNSE